jgi:hypothetical protein
MDAAIRKGWRERYESHGRWSRRPPSMQFSAVPRASEASEASESILLVYFFCTICANPAIMDGRTASMLGTDQMTINSFGLAVSARALHLLIVVFAAGCVDSDRLRLLSGPGVDINAIDLQNYRVNQDVVVQNLMALAGYAPESPIGDWTPVVDAGIGFVNQRCEAYLDAIFWFNRYKSTTANEISLLGAGTASALGIVQASARDIALVALAFGITAQTVEVLSSSILYKIDPAAVKSLVDASQAIYLQSIKDIRYTSRSKAVLAIQGYLNLCLPATLEAQVMAAVNKTTFTVVVPPGSNAVPRVIQNTPPPSEVKTIEFNQRAPERVSLEQILLYNTQTQSYDPTRIALMRLCWRELGIPVQSLADFLAKEEFAGFHGSVVACIQQKINAAGERTPVAMPPKLASNRPSGPITLHQPAPAPSTRVDPALLTALEFNPQTNKYDPSRVNLMRRCWSDLKISVPSQSVTIFIGEPRFRVQDQSVAACIEQNATKTGDSHVDAGLLTALKFNAQTSDFDPVRIGLMKRCWSDLKISVPSQSIAIYLAEPRFRAQDQTVAHCIEQKAAKEGESHIDVGLLNALKFNPQTSDFDPARVGFMQQCWRDLNISVPSQSTTVFLGDSRFRSQDQNVATCIEQKATQGGQVR